MNIPNTLTIFRILLVPGFIGLLVYERYDYGLAVFLLAGLTDALDGIIARLANQRTMLGTYLDPLADKLLLSSGFVTLGVLHLIPLWAAIIVVSRDVILLAGTVIAQLTESAADITPTMAGKITTVLQLAYVILVIFLSWRDMDLGVLTPLLYLLIVFTLASGLHYLYRGFARLSSRAM